MKMKLKFSCIVMAAALFMAACSDDNNSTPNPALEVAGTYSGSLVMTVSGSDAGTDDDSSVTIAGQDNGKVEITLGAFGTGNMSLEDIVIPDVEVTAANDGSYSVTGTINATSGSLQVTGSLEGTVKDKQADIVFTIRPGAMPMDIVATYTGSKQGK